MREVNVGKNVSLKLSNLVLIQEYQNKTRQGFSKTLNIILQEWDKYSIEIEKIKQREEEERISSRFADIKRSKVVK